LTFTEMTELEPRLKTLYLEANSVRPASGCFCGNRVWYDNFKPRLVNLVGWYAERPELCSPGCYDVAYQTVYNALPDCGERCPCCM